jgi:hypothetical protein
MKMLSSIFASVLLAAAIALSPTTSSAQNAQDDKQGEFIRNWYDICQTKKIVDQCYQLSKELIEKYPTSDYRKYAEARVKEYDTAKSYEKFLAALKAYNGAPDDKKLEQLFTFGEEYLKIQPEQQFVMAYMAMAGASGVLFQSYKNLDKVKAYGEKALAVVESQTPPKDWKQEDWNSLRDDVRAQVNQFKGYYLIETKGNEQEAIECLTKATQVKSKDTAGWKDPNNYMLRGRIYINQYEQLSAEYGKLTDEEKTGEVGKALLTRINQLIDTKIIPDLARVIAVANRPELKPLAEDARKPFDSFWKFRTEAPEKAPEYIKAFSGDPTVQGPAIPVKADVSLNVPTPVVGSSNTKLAPGASTNSTKTGAKNGSGTKSSTTKGRSTTRNKRGRKG